MQDWGGPLGMRLAVERPDRVARLVVMNTGIFSGRPPSDTWLRFRELVRRSGTEFQAGSADPADVHERAARGRRRRLRRAVPDTGVEDRHADVPRAGADRAGASVRARRCARCARSCESWDRPALVFFGDSDPIFSPRVAERLAELIPGAELQEPIAGAGHFLQEDAGEEVGQRIAAWLKSTSV